MKFNLSKLLYQARNWRAHARAIFFGSFNWLESRIARKFGCQGDAKAYGVLFATIIRKDGTVIDLGCVGRRVVTTAGVNYMRDDFNAAAGSADITNFKYHGCGTGTTAEAITDTALVTETETRVTGSQSGAVSKIYVTAAQFTFSATRAITEHGIFSASSSGTLWDRTVFSALNVVSGDTITFTYSLTIADGN